MTERFVKTDGLSLADVVRLMDNQVECDRLDAMFEAENYDIFPDGYCKSRTAVQKLPLMEQRGSARSFWSEVVSARGTVEEIAVQLAALKLPSHVLNKLLLDMVVDLLPIDEELPKTFVDLLRGQLGLPQDHAWGSWPITAGMRDDRGKPAHELRNMASLIDCKYLLARLTHPDPTTRARAEPMPLNMLQREVATQSGGRAPATKSLREWRQNYDYWNLSSPR
ncbi:hypothetical protein ABIB94_002798 [Bradyrhizobium sp. JR7.2]|uniref:hypothetical protein n=1 Tax=unclassified Bradyrhizobium TaxID=2631580 RepID=UPI0033951341